MVAFMPEHKVMYRNRDGVRRWSYTDDDKPGKIGVYTEVDMDRVLESIKEAQEYEASRTRPLHRHLARIPMTVYERSIHEGWDEAKWKQWLNDPANDAFRVWRGRV